MQENQASKTVLNHWSVANIFSDNFAIRGGAHGYCRIGDLSRAIVLLPRCESPRLERRRLRTNPLDTVFLSPACQVVQSRLRARFGPTLPHQLDIKSIRESARSMRIFM